MRYEYSVPFFNYEREKNIALRKLKSEYQIFEIIN